MSPEEDSPGPAEDVTYPDGLGRTTHSRSREPREDTVDEPSSEGAATTEEPTTEESTSAHGTPAPAGTAKEHADTPWRQDDLPPAQPRRRGRRIAVGIGAAVLLAGGGFAAGHAVGDGGPGDGGPGGPGSVRHHHGHDGRSDGVGGPGRSGQAPSGQETTGQGAGGQAPAGENTSAGSGAILGGLFT